MISDYEADGVNNRYWFGGRRVPGTGNPGEWVWEDGTNMEFTYVQPLLVHV